MAKSKYVEVSIAGTALPATLLSGYTIVSDMKLGEERALVLRRPESTSKPRVKKAPAKPKVKLPLPVAATQTDPRSAEANNG